MKKPKRVDVLPIELKTKPKRIFFTLFGFLQGFVFFILYLFALNYTNNETLFGGVFVGFLYLSSVVRNYRCLKNITVVNIVSTRPFEEEEGVMHIYFQCHSAQRPLCTVELNQVITELNFDENGFAVAAIPFTKEQFGVYKIPSLVVSSVWPFCISKTWIKMYPQATVNVLPNFQYNSVSQTDATDDTGVSSIPVSIGDVEGLRDVNKGETGVRIAWKQSFRHNKMLTYTYEKTNKKIVVVVWPDNTDSNRVKIQKVFAQMKTIVSENKSFQISCGDYISPIGDSIVHCEEIISDLMELVLDEREWLNDF